MGGVGLIVYFLKEPFEPYQYDYSTAQWMEFGREQNNLWWIESIKAISEEQIVFTIDPNGDRAGTFSFNIATGEVEKV